MTYCPLSSLVQKGLTVHSLRVMCIWCHRILGLYILKCAHEQCGMDLSKMNLPRPHFQRVIIGWVKLLAGKITGALDTYPKEKGRGSHTLSSKGTCFWFLDFQVKFRDLASNRRSEINITLLHFFFFVFFAL